MHRFIQKDNYLNEYKRPELAQHWNVIWKNLLLLLSFIWMLFVGTLAGFAVIETLNELIHHVLCDPTLFFSAFSPPGFGFFTITLWPRPNFNPLLTGLAFEIQSSGLLLLLWVLPLLGIIISRQQKSFQKLFPRVGPISLSADEKKEKLGKTRREKKKIRTLKDRFRERGGNREALGILWLMPLYVLVYV